MNRLRLVVALAASAALAPMAAAQTVTDPDPLSAPQIGIAGARQPAPVQAPPRVAAPAVRPVAPPPGPRGSHWNAPSAAPRPAAPVYSARPAEPGPAAVARDVRREVRQPAPPMRTGQAQGRYRQNGQMQTGRMYAGRHGGAVRGGTMHGGGYRQFHRVQRGGHVPRYWWGPQFVVRNWGAYGFPQPYAGSRWVRYYDDALLIDRYGRVHDVRADWDWNRSGERWSEDDDGVPVYVGDGEFEPEDWDYEWAEGWDRGEQRGQAYAEDCRPTPGGVCGAGYGEAYPGYGYGYGYAPCACGPVVVTETTVATPAVVEQVTYYDYVEERVARPAAKVRSKRVKVQRIPVEPYRGEKG